MLNNSENDGRLHYEGGGRVIVCLFCNSHVPLTFRGQCIVSTFVLTYFQQDAT